MSSLIVCSLALSASMASILTKEGSLEVNGPTTKFTREKRDAVSLFEVQSRLSNLEKWKDTELELNLAKANVQTSLQTVAAGVQATNNIMNPVISQIQAMQSSLDQIKADVPLVISEDVNNLQNSMIDRLNNFSSFAENELEGFQSSMDEAFSTLNTDTNTLSASLSTLTKQGMDSVNAAHTAAIAKVQPARWCFKWGDGVDNYNQNWRNYPGMTCKIKSTSGWLKITIEGRTYGQNHGGLRVVGGGHTFGKQGTYGFQWMNSEHNGHRWLPFTIVRYVKATPNAETTFSLQYRSQSNSARFHIAGGTYANQYSGLWWSMEEMRTPMSKQ